MVHSDPLRAVVEFGYLGVIACLVLLATTYWALRRSNVGSSLPTALIAAMGVHSLAANVAGTVTGLYLAGMVFSFFAVQRQSLFRRKASQLEGISLDHPSIRPRVGVDRRNQHVY